MFVWPTTSNWSLKVYAYTMTRHKPEALWRKGWQCRSVSHSPPLWFSLTSTIGWIAIKYCTYIHDLQRMNPTDFGDILTFQLH